MLPAGFRCWAEWQSPDISGHLIVESFVEERPFQGRVSPKLMRTLAPLAVCSWRIAFVRSLL